jgi:hypothetical protein
MPLFEFRVERNRFMDMPVDQMKAWRVVFAAKEAAPVPQGEASVLVFDEPRETIAVFDPIALADAGGDRPAGALDLVWLPPSAGPTLDLEKRLEAESADVDGRRTPPIRASLRSVRVVWSDSCALIAAPADQLDESIDAVVRFTLAERAMAKIEREMAALWPEIDATKALTHSVSRRQLAERRKLDARTERATDLNVMCMKLEKAIEQLDPRLAGGSKRLYAELVLQAGIYDRLEVLADPIDYADEICERANSRLTETRHAWTGFYLEALIVVVLVAEVLALVLAKL